LSSVISNGSYCPNDACSLATLQVYPDIFSSSLSLFNLIAYTAILALRSKNSLRFFKKEKKQLTAKKQKRKRWLKRNRNREVDRTQT